MISSGDRIVLGVSGGADSVCLLFVLLEYAKRMPLQLAVVHVNHMLRTDAGEDAEFVAQLCRRADIPFFLQEADVAVFAAQEKLSLEEAGRELRYRAFCKTADALQANRIAVAHSANDRAETMLFHLFRGSGMKGLCGIPPSRERIIRPLLCLQRSEIEAYLKDRGLSYRTDHTNLEDGYTRNRIRHHVIPWAEQEVSAGAVEHMCRTADILSETEEYLSIQTEAAMERCVEMRETDPVWAAVRVEPFRQLHAALQKRLLLALLRELAPGGKDISAVHVENVRGLFEKNGYSRTDLPFHIRAVREYDRVLLERRESPGAPEPVLPYREIALPVGETQDPLRFDLGIFGQIEVSVFFANGEQKIPGMQYTKWFDCDKMKESPVLRCRRAGDFLSIADGAGGIIHKSLKKYMITEKIPREVRSRTVVMAEGSHVLWLAGYRISEYYKVTENTKRIMQVKLIKDCADSGTEEKDGRAYKGTFVGGGSGCQDQGDRRPDQQGLCGKAGASGVCP